MYTGALVIATLAMAVVIFTSRALPVLLARHCLLCHRPRILRTRPSPGRLLLRALVILLVYAMGQVLLR